MTHATNKKSVIFLTGATGLLGSYLLKIFLENDHKVFILGRSKNGISAKKRVIDTLRFWDKGLVTKIHNLTVVEGDIRKRGLGIERIKAHRLADHVDEIFHAAAITQLSPPLKEIHAVNVQGTKNVLDRALKWHKSGRLKKVNHISTAYVYGNYTKSFTEKDMDKGQHFNTNYERTKFEAEKLVLQYRKKGLWIDIFRPSMILGESTTGKTFQFLHIYQFLKLCKLELFDSLPLADCYASLVPVDITARAIYILDQNCLKKNLTYHPFPSKLNSVAEVIRISAKIMGFKPPQAVNRSEFTSGNMTSVQKMLLTKNLSSMNFITGLNSALTNSILKKCGFKIPLMDTKSLHIMLNYVTDPAIKKR